MLGILLIFFIGKYFFELAKTHNKNKWLFGFIGIGTYYGSTLIFGLLIGVYMAFSGDISLIENNELLITLLGIPFGILVTWGVYFLLKKSWMRSPVSEDLEILDNSQIDF